MVFTVGDVVVADVVEEETTCPTQQWAIHCCSSTSQEGPCIFTIMRNCGVGVMKKGKHDLAEGGLGKWTVVKQRSYRSYVLHFDVRETELRSSKG